MSHLSANLPKTTMPAVKFCGFTQAQDIQNAVNIGVNAIGLVFYPPSPRAVTVEQAQQLVKTIPPFTTIVALVVNMGENELRHLAKNVAFDVLQFHGDETPAECQALANAVQKRWYKAIRVTHDDTEQTLLVKIAELKNCGAVAVLLDAYHPDKFGGTGDSFDWEKIPKNSPLPIILAGGLTADNVGEAIATLCQKDRSVYGVDVSGGIESHKGIKSADKMQDFFNKVKNL